MTKKALFLFPGQGAQYPRMALDFLEKGGEGIKKLFSCASDIYGSDMAALLASEPENLKRSDVCQPALTLANLAAMVYLKEKGIQPCACAGFSLGEFAALAAAGIVSTEDCFRLVVFRGKAMQAAVDKISSGNEAPGMAAVAGLDPIQVESLIKEWKEGSSPDLKEIYAANINSPRQTVVSGSFKALKAAEKLFLEKGAKRFIPLQVAGPYHSPFMESAAVEFKPVLEKITFNDPVVPFYSNVNGKQVLSGKEAKELSLAQITSAVRWVDEEKSIISGRENTGFEIALEAGPGKVLQGLWKDICNDIACNDIACSAAGTAEDVDKLVLN